MKISFKKRLMVILTLLALVLCAKGVTPTQAATYIVSNLYDSGAGSLRQAITDANATSGADTITFSVSGTITCFSRLPIITDAAGLTIDGTGQTVYISGDTHNQVFFVTIGASLTLDNLTIAFGNHGGSGGGIENIGTLTITNSTFLENSASAGGAIVNYDTLIITNSTFLDNSAVTNGGAIENAGGSLFAGTLTVTNSTFSGNSATSWGGGIYNGGSLTITNSTFSGNTAGTGGGIYKSITYGTLTLLNTIVANSTSGGNCGGTIINGGNNIDDGTTCGWGSTDGSMSSTDPLLGTIADNSGPTQTFELLTGSPAIDGVTFNAPNSAPSTDQRGFARPQGKRYDIGAFESGLGYHLYLPIIVR